MPSTVDTVQSCSEYDDPTMEIGIAYTMQRTDTDRTIPTRIHPAPTIVFRHIFIMQSNPHTVG